MKLFWFKNTSVWMALIYILVGIVLMLFPEVSGKVFCAGLAVGALIYAFNHLYRYMQENRRGYQLYGSLIAGILFILIGLVCLFRPMFILSILPFALGILLLMDGLAKLPFMIEMVRMHIPYSASAVVGALLPLVLGVYFLFNPFHAAKNMIFLFGLGLLLDGIFDFIAAHNWKKSNKF